MSRLSLVLSVVATSALLAAGPADAAKDVHADPAGDMVVAPGQLPDGPTPAPEVRPGDITALVTKHKARTVLLTTRFVERTDDFVAWRVKTPGDSYFIRLTILGLPGPTAGLLEIGRQSTGSALDCPGLRRVAVRGTATLIAWTEPRRCLGDPRWVRAGTLATDSVDNTQYADESHRVGRADQANVKVGRKVKVG